MVKKEFTTKTEELNQIRETKVRELLNKISPDHKTTPTPFGDVYAKLNSIWHIRPLHNGEIIATWTRHERTGSKKEVFTWMGVVEKSEYNVIENKYKIYYRPFVSQFDKIKERENQLYTNQLYGRR